MSQQGDDYRLRADEADEWARNVTDEGVRKQFEELAIHFRDQAITVEGPGLLIDFDLPKTTH